MQGIYFLTLDDALKIHLSQIDLYGGSDGLRDLGLLESAIYRPQTTFGGNELYPTMFLKAACLMHSLVLNHSFVDGNKRTGTVAALIFLEVNGLTVMVGQEELVEVAMKVGLKQWGIEEIAEWMEKSVEEVN